MNQYKTTSQLKNLAREKMSGKYGSAILMNFVQVSISLALTFSGTFFITLLSQLLSFFSGKEQLDIGTFLLTTIFNLICSMFIGIFNTGIALFYLNVISGRTCSLTNLFYGFQYLFKKSFTISTVTAVISSVCLLPYDILYFKFVDNMTPELGLSTIAAMLIGIILFLPISLALSQSYFLLLDFPSYSAKEVMLLSIRIMKGRKWKLFCIQLSFFPLLLLGYLSFGIGLLWVMPYLNATMSAYFLDIMNPARQSEMC